MTKQEMLYIAAAQSAIDCGCKPEDFFDGKHHVVRSACHPDARKYLKLPFSLDLVSYGSNIVASVSEEYAAIAEEYIHKFQTEHCFETPNLHYLSDQLAPFGQRICFMAEYFLADPDKLKELPCPYPTKLLTAEDFKDLYLPCWSNALCEDRKHLDVLGVGAYDGDKLIGLAGCSADCDSMWQIGIDVLPEYRRQGIAAALTASLALEIINRGKVPFYCAAWSNIRSVRNAIKAGFYPAWVEMTAKPAEFVAQMNQ